MKTSKTIFLVVLTICIQNCSYDSESDLIDAVNAPVNPGELVNYTDDILPIIQSSCTGCHGNPPTNGAPFSLINFNQVSQRANGILNRMSLQNGSPGAMPPSGRLPQATIDLVQQWIDDGKPEN